MARSGATVQSAQSTAQKPCGTELVVSAFTGGNCLNDINKVPDNFRLPFDTGFHARVLAPRRVTLLAC